MQDNAIGKSTARPAGLRFSPRNFLCFVMPITALSFLLTAPHEPWLSWCWLLPLLISIVLDVRSPAERRQPADRLPTRAYDAILYTQFVLQLLIVGLAVWVVASYTLTPLEMIVALIVVGLTSGYSGIVVAHELMHRSSPHLRFMARVLMAGVLYEHFFTEHIRGHHARVGTSADPATARFDETFIHFFFRTVPAQFLSAWELECRRNQLPGVPNFQPAWLRHRVLQGLVVEWAVALGILLWLGAGAFTFYILQAVFAVVLLESVNYFEHWGLERSTSRVHTIDSWDTESVFTLNTLVGLSRHSDHHANASRPFYRLQHHSESPKLPYGYFGIVPLLVFRNATFRKRMTEELQRAGLGPFRHKGQDAGSAAPITAEA
jgi:alkane 1-monooxygenase